MSGFLSVFENQELSEKPGSTETLRILDASAIPKSAGGRKMQKTSGFLSVFENQEFAQV